MTRLWLTGFMGTGKTTIGKLLGGRFGLPFVDMDEEIERRAGCTISELFARHGEAAFRSMEREILRELAAAHGRIIATGGGALLSDDNRQIICPGDTVICLTCEPQELEERLANVSDRPLLSSGGGQAMRELLARRGPSYSRFEQLDTTGREPTELAAEIGRRGGLGQLAEIEFATDRRSRVIVERGALQLVGSLLSDASLGGDVVLVSDEALVALGMVERVQSAFEKTDRTVHRAIIPPGEEHKSLDTLTMLYGLALDGALERRAVVIGLGGGVVGDLAGMFAATYLRGLQFVLIPTTLVAQVDAAIGGKVGVDFQNVKNMIGAFYPADLVVIDPEVLRSVPQAGLADGLAEMVKIALMRSPSLLAALEDLPNAGQVVENASLIRVAALEKIRVVERDPREQGERELLNFGHSIGHAVEAASRYRLSHGAAIAVGMLAETRLAEALGWCTPDVLERLACLLSRFDLPSAAPDLDPEIVLGFLGQDKKRKGRQVRFAVPTTVGDWGVFAVTDSQARQAVSWALGATP